MNSILPNANPNATGQDVILVGAGIMSATLGVILKEVELEPEKLRPAALQQAALRSFGHVIRDCPWNPQAQRIGPIAWAGSLTSRCHLAVIALRMKLWSLRL